MDKTFEILKHQKINRFAIMGGTFDPIHLGHLAAAEEVKAKYCLEKIIFMPAGDPPHKQISSISKFEHRYNMVKAATYGVPYFLVSDIENSRAGKTYTVDTMRQIREYMGYEVQIYFITGADSVLEIGTWKDPEELLSYCSLLAVPRPGYDKKALIDKIEELNYTYKGCVEMVDISALDISSTNIRRRMADNLPVTGMVPEAVLEYISANHLYMTQG